MMQEQGTKQNQTKNKIEKHKKSPWENKKWWLKGKKIFKGWRENLKNLLEKWGKCLSLENKWENVAVWKSRQIRMVTPKTSNKS